MKSYMLCVDCYAVPGEGHIIDAIDPTTGLTFHYQKSAAAVLAANPGAIRLPLEDWSKARAVLQRTPIIWDPTTADQYDAMLGCLPPIDWTPAGFLVGEPDDHDAGNGQPRFRAYRYIGTGTTPRYYRSSRPLTRAEFTRELAGRAESLVEDKSDD
jgi:hypothetical protein